MTETTELSDEDMAEPSFSNGINYALERLANIIGVKEWLAQDGSETLEGDVDATIIKILETAKIRDKEDGRIASVEDYWSAYRSIFRRHAHTAEV